MKKILWIDTETTGLEPGRHGIIQVAGHVEIDGVIIDSFKFHMRPLIGTAIEQEALDVHGYSIDQIENFPDPIIVKIQLTEIFDRHVNKFDRGDKFIIAGMRTDFDFNMMKVFWEKMGDKYFGSYVDFSTKIDLLPLINILRAMNIIELENAKLETISKYFGVEIQAHDALSDITATREVFYKVVNKYIKVVEDNGK